MKNWYKEEINDLYKRLNSSENGLTNNEVNKRLNEYGLNALPDAKKHSVFSIFISEFKDPIILLLIVAVIASFIAGEIIDGLAILFIVLVDAIMGTFQENKANNTAEALKKLVTNTSIVLRNGKKTSVPSENLVIGDIVYLESGDKVSADARIIECHNLTVNESILTGESVNVEKNNDILYDDDLSVSEQFNMLFSGSTIVTGRCTCIITTTGINTQMGNIAQTLNDTKDEKSPLTIRVEKLSKQISLLLIFIAIIITFLLIAKGLPANEIFLSVVALAVSAMPEGLPLALTMALTIASNKMAKKNVVVKKLHSVESLGSCTVIASDKTGTLTVNEQTAKKIILPNNIEYEITGTGYELEGQVIGDNLKPAYNLALCGVINNESSMDNDKFMGDSIDIAFLVLGKKLNVDATNIKIIDSIPYESENKYSAVFYEEDNKCYCTVKGSLEVVSSFCSNINYKRLEKQNISLASDGYRVIAVAKGLVKRKNKYTEKDINNLGFLGMVGFIDPIRKDAIESIQECKRSGIKVLMITGDHPLTAFSIAKELNLTDIYDEVTTGSEVELFYKKGEKEFDKFVKSKKVFTRVTPLQKLYIVESLKRQGEFVAVTGDGVNDAPALKSANIGVAMGSGSDIARETAKMIIMDDKFTSIVEGIKEGRNAYANIRKIILFLLSCGVAEVLFFCLAIVFNLPMPLVAIQLLWLNVVTDGIQDFSLSFEKSYKSIENKPSNNIIDKGLLREILVSSISIALVVFYVWHLFINVIKMDVNVARGYIMALMVFIQNIHVFNCRSENKSAFSVPILNNKILLYGVVGSIILQVIIMEVDFFSKFLQTTSIPIMHLVMLFIYSLSILIIMEIYKCIRKYKK